MCHAVPGISGSDINIRFDPGVCSDEGETVDRFHNLTGPVVFGGSSHWESFAHPAVQAIEPIVGVIRLPRLVVFASHDDHLMLSCFLQPHVMEWVGGIPIERGCHRSFGNPRPYHITSVSSLLGVYPDDIVYRGIGSYHYRGGGHNRTSSSCNPTWWSGFDLFRMRAGKDSSAAAFDCLRQTIQIFQRMKLGLLWKPQTRAGFKGFQGSACDTRNLSQSGTVRGL